MSASSELPHSAILGKWQSDEAKTLASMREIGGLCDSANEIFQNWFFGQLIVEYSSDSVRSLLLDEEWDGGFQKYEVMDVAPDRVRIRVWEGSINDWLDSDIHIDGEYLYVISGAMSFREYFRRIA